MSQGFADLDVIASPLPSPLPSPLQPNPLSQSTTPTPTPTQGDYQKSHLPHPRVVEEPKHSAQCPQQDQHAVPHRNVETERERARRREEREADEDKFSTLFSPPTPRASPVMPPTSRSPIPVSDALLNLEASDSTASPLFNRPARPPNRPYNPSGNSRPASIISTVSSDFGSFVEVGTAGDPLSSTNFEVGFAPVVATTGRAGDVTPLPPVSASTRESSADPSTRHQNATTLNFFDTFTQDAKQRSSAARSQVLDELLQHEDDPMWFVVGDNSNSADENEISIPSLSLPSPPPPAPPPKSPKDHGAVTPFSDIDHDFFRPSPGPSTRPSPSASPMLLHRTSSRSTSIPPPTPPTLAPPISSQYTASQPPLGRSQPSLGTLAEFDPLSNVNTESPIPTPDSQGGPPMLGSTGRSSSYQTISALPSKLMSTLLRGGPPSSQPTGRRPALESIFNPGQDDNTKLGQRRNASLPPAPSPSGNEHDNLFRSQTLSDSWSSSSSSSNPPHRIQPVNITHNTPFAPATITHSTSPFAPTIYVPPSGAPGFKGEGYGWDKGFSDELENERQGSAPIDHGNDRSARNGGLNPISNGSSSADADSFASRSRGGWGSGFGFGFGSVRAGKAKSSTTPSPSSSILGLGSKRPLSAQHQGMATASVDWQRSDKSTATHAGYDRQSLSAGNGMGDFIERKIGKVELVGRKASSDSVLHSELTALLRAHLPALSRLPRSWNLIYSLDQHGISLNTLYSRCEAHLTRKPAPGEFSVSQGMLFILKDAASAEGGEDDEHRAVFGAWIAEGLRLNKGKGYSGGGESFLWKYVDSQLKVFKTTGKNNYVSLCEPDFISFGGGDGHYGLYLDDSLFDGSSAPCPTFDNEPLCTADGRHMKESKFECVGLEVWGM